MLLTADQKSANQGWIVQKSALKDLTSKKGHEKHEKGYYKVTRDVLAFLLHFKEFKTDANHIALDLLWFSKKINLTIETCVEWLRQLRFGSSALPLSYKDTQSQGQKILSSLAKHLACEPCILREVKNIANFYAFQSKGKLRVNNLLMSFTATKDIGQSAVNNRLENDKLRPANFISKSVKLNVRIYPLRSFYEASLGIVSPCSMRDRQCNRYMQ